MRGVTVSTILVLLSFAVPPARAAKEEFTGGITFRDGTVSSYTWLAFRHDEIPFARDPGDLQHYEVAAARLRLLAIARIDFDNSTAARKQVASALPAYLTSSVRRATVTFRDGAVYRGVYLYAEGEWGNARERGRLTMPSIVSVTVSSANVAACPVCGERFPDAGYGFCPFDGAKLSRPATTAVAPTAVTPREQRPGEGSMPANTKEWWQWAPASSDRQGRQDGSALQAGLGRGAGAVPRVVAGGVLRPLPLCGDWTQGGGGTHLGPDCAGRPSGALDRPVVPRGPE